MNLRLITLTLAAMLCLPAPALADDAKQLTATIQKRYETMQAFSAAFTQTLTNKASQEKEERSGTIAFKKPHLIRWQTTTPENELLVATEKELWDYFADEQVAYRYNVKDTLDSKTMLKFIAGRARLEEDFHVSRLPDENGLAKLDLVPIEPEPGLVQAYIWVEPESGLLRRVLLRDFYGNENELRFEDVKLNPSLPADHFTFTPPAEAMIMDNVGQQDPSSRSLMQ